VVSDARWSPQNVAAVGDWLQADPLYRLDDTAFAALARTGVIGPDRRPDGEIVAAVAAGDKPVGHISDHPGGADDPHSPVREALRAGLHVRYVAAYNGNAKAYVIARDPALLEQTRNALLLPEPALDVALGRLLGYPERDIAAYLTHNFGGRPRGAELEKQMVRSLESREQAERSGSYQEGWQRYRPWTADELRQRRPVAPGRERVSDRELG
jgi:hypothetical protein